ncbi:hypothetical protein [Halostella sp. PRR32]|uniref:hypothetical protein n=1 Tax=Halostella sp. PRR32 TaxID=3098147 RepID=UPI002B1D9B33|nr:hypothetical protein [Halostella sp. PRR32]
MRYFFAVALIALAVVAGVTPVGASATQENDTVPNATVPNPDGPTDFRERVDSVVRVVDFGMTGDETMEITFEADVPTRVTIQEAGAFEQGSGQINIKQSALAGNGDRTTVEISISDPDNAAVIVSTRRSIDRGTATFLSPTDSTSGILNRPVTWAVTILSVAGSFTAGLIGVKKWRDWNIDEQEKRRVEEIR